MSANTIRGERSDGQLRRGGGGRSGSAAANNRGYSGKFGAAATPAPPPSPADPSPLHQNRSFKKAGNGQGLQSRPSLQNGTHAQASQHDVSVSSITKPADASSSRSSNYRAVLKAPSHQTAAAGAPDVAAPTTPAKGDTAKQFTLQFGSISPGIMNGMQIPARTSSAPPNLDEQKRDQARHDSFRIIPALPIPSAPKPQPQNTKKDVDSANQSNTGQPHPPTQSKRDMHSQVSSASAASVPKSSFIPAAGMSMPMPFQQTQISSQFGGPGPQIQMQGVAASSLQMPMTLPVGSAPQVPQQMFIPLQSHPLQSQAMMHQGHGLGFAPQMGHQLPPQIGNMGIALGPQFTVQPPGKFSAQRKTTAVKITHPETHEELRLDKRIDGYSDGGASGRALNLTSQSQPVPAFTSSHQLNYYPPLQPNSYNSSPVFYPTPTSLPNTMTSTQMASGPQASRYSYPVGQNGQSLSFMNHSVLNPIPGSKSMPPPSHGASEAVNLESLPVFVQSAPIQVTMKPAVYSTADKLGTPPVAISIPVSKAEAVKFVKQPEEVSPVDRIATVTGTVSTLFVKDEAQESIKPPVEVSVVDKVGKPSVIISNPVIKDEVPKSVKPRGDASAHRQRKNGIAVEDAAKQPKPISEPSDSNSVATTNSHSSVASTMLSTQKMQSETSSPPVVPAGDYGPVLSGIDGRRREPIRRSDSWKDRNKKTNKKDMRHSPQQPQPVQPDTSNSVLGTKLPSSKTTTDSTEADVIAQQDPMSSENDQALSGVDVSAPCLHSYSHSVDYCVSSKVEPFETAKDKTEVSGVLLEEETLQEVPDEKQTLQGVSAISLVVSGTEETEVSTFANGTVEISAISAASMVETKLENVDSNLCLEDHILVKIGHKEEQSAATEHWRSDVSIDSSQSISNAEVCPASGITELSDLKSEVLINQEGSVSEISDEVNANEGEFKRQQLDTSNIFILETDGKLKELDRGATASSPLIDAESDTSSRPQSANADEDRPPSSCATKNRSKTVCNQDVVIDSVESHLETISTSALASSEVEQKLEVPELSAGAPFSLPKKKSSLEPTRSKVTYGKKKKIREILAKADAAGNSDLYNAYKGSEEKNEATNTPGSAESFLHVDVKPMTVDIPHKVVAESEEYEQGKTEVDDWEDAADISAPKLKMSEDGQQIRGVKKHHENDNEAQSGRKYSRDFLLTFSEQCRALPIGFEIGSDIANSLMNAPASTTYIVDHEQFPSSGRMMDRSPRASRIDHRPSGVMDDDRWMKTPASFGPGRDVRLDVGQGAAVVSSRPGQGANHGVLRNLRGPSSSGGILSGPMQSLPSQGGGAARYGADADRWQRGTGIQRGLIPPPQTPAQIMHKAANKYEIGKVSDEETAKQRQLKAILNKLTPQNFEKLFAQVEEVNIDNAVTLTGVISQIFDKALTEPTFCEMYANFCFHLAGALPDFSEDNEKITFKRLLLNKCQEEFERGEREQAEASNTEEEGEVKQSENERELKRLKARRRMLGNIRLIGELYKKKMLTERIMHECIKKLLGEYQNPDEEDIEALCKLMSTIGEIIDHPKAKEHMDAYFVRMLNLSTNQKLSSRVRFMLKDAIELRKNRWQQRRKVDGPKKIEEVHRDAAQERQAQASRTGRGPVSSSSSRRGLPMDYGLRGSNVLPLPSSQIGGSRGFPTQVRGHGTQDVRLEEKHHFENKTPSVPLPQRTNDDNPITLGPQGGLARGMSIRGQPLLSHFPLSDSSGISDPRRVASGLNGHSSRSDRLPHKSRDEITPRYMSDRLAGASYDQPSVQDRNINSGDRDPRIVDRTSERFSSTTLSQGLINSNQTATSEAKPLSEEVLREKSISAIREFYSAKDENEVALCIRELNSPNFYPDMVSLWITDSFERKDMERDLLTRLLVKLNKSQDRLLSQVQLVQGFESVLSSLEEAVNDAPRAAEFLGRIFSKIILENVVPFREIGRLIHEGGEEPGHLLEIGLAADVLGSTLEFIQAEKGDLVLNQIRTSSDLKLEDFRPPHPIKSKKLDVFLQR